MWRLSLLKHLLVLRLTSTLFWLVRIFLSRLQVIIQFRPCWRHRSSIGHGRSLILSKSVLEFASACGLCRFLELILWLCLILITFELIRLKFCADLREESIGGFGAFRDFTLVVGTSNHRTLGRSCPFIKLWLSWTSGKVFVLIRSPLRSYQGAASFIFGYRIFPALKGGLRGRFLSGKSLDIWTITCCCATTVFRWKAWANLPAAIWDA